MPFANLIFELSSRFHLTDGSGDPVALQLSVILAPSLTVVSLELELSSMFGGTVIKEKRISTNLNHYIYSEDVID